MANPEQHARSAIDQLLTAAGWSVQDVKQADLHAARGVALREFALNEGYGSVDYLLYVDGKAAGLIEAKKQGATPTGVEGSYLRGSVAKAGSPQATRRRAARARWILAPTMPRPGRGNVSGACRHGAERVRSAPRAAVDLGKLLEEFAGSRQCVKGAEMGLDLPPRLIKLETFDSQAQRQPAEACYLGKIYRVGEERNAWQWARSRQTSNRLGFQLNYPDARKAAEVQRTQGSRWHLQEWPAIVVEGTDTAIVACDIRINEPFLAFENAAPADGSLCSFAMVFAPRRGAHPRIFVVARGIVPPARLPFQQKTSRSSGANYLLSWLPINANLELKYATALVASFNAFLQQAVQP